jgi:hypothetical protein
MVIESLKRDPDHVDYPDFDFNKFTEYLSRGVWPFLMRLVLGLIIGLPLGILAGVMMGVGVAVAVSTKTPGLIAVFYIFAFGFALVAGILSELVLLPAGLHAGLSREFNLGRAWSFTKDFNKRVWKEVLLSLLFVMAVGVVAEIVGILLFCVGFFFTVAAVVMAQHHLMFQLYMLYLQRGGAPIVPAGKPSRADDLLDDELPADDRRDAADRFRGEPGEPGEPDDRFRAEG